MQFLLSFIADGSEVDSPEVQTAIDVVNERMQAEGSWVFAGGLGEPDAIVVDNRGAEAIITDGPFAETKEYVAGFWIIDVADREAARKLAIDASKACDRKVEIRPFLAPPASRRDRVSGRLDA